MSFDAEKHHRRSVRLAGYDYTQAGAYFLTICAARKRPIFGRMENDAVRLHPYGKIVADEWERTALLRSDVMLDEWIIMPDHFHAIVIFRRGMACHAQNLADTQNLAMSDTPLGMARHAPTFGKRESQSLGAVVGSFKSAVTRAVNRHRAARGFSPVVAWQRGFYETIIRHEKHLAETRRYILENPLRQANRI